MAQPFGQTGTADPIAAEYLAWQSAEGSCRVHLHLDAVDGLARDVIERSQGLPVEVGGLLLGHATRGEKPAVWVERYQRVECEHRSGPHFVLGEDELAGLESRAAELSGDLSVVGFYRSHLRPGFGLETPDRDLITRYFKDREDLFLLIGPDAESSGEMRAQFFLHAADGEIRAAEPAFPFRGRIVSQSAEHEHDDPRERTGRSGPAPLQGERLGRLVPDFIPSAERPPEVPARDLFASFTASPNASPTEDLEHQRGFLARRWPLLAALLLVGGGVAVFLQQTAHRAPPQQTVDSVAVRPLGLYVDPTGTAWRVSWNSSATALQGARGVQLFVRDGAEDQNRIELSAQDLQSATYRYQAKGGDVTFRLEVTDSGGHVQAESFRLLKTVEKPAAPQPAPVSSTPPKVTDKVAPVVAASIRPRIRGTIGIDVRVHVDTQGRVTSASPVTKAHTGLQTYLAGRAVAAAKQWRFKPATEDGKPVPGTEVIHFNFER